MNTFAFSGATLAVGDGGLKQGWFVAMRRSGSTVIGFTIFALVDGFLIGLIAGIFAQTALPAAAPAIDTNEYVWLVSVDYAGGADLPKATRRLSALQSGTLSLPGLVRRVARQAESRHDSMRAASLTRLAVALTGDVASVIDDAPAVETETPAPVIAAQEPVPTVHNVPNSGPAGEVGRSASAGSADAFTSIGPPSLAQMSYLLTTGTMLLVATPTASQRRVVAQNAPLRAATHASGAPATVDFKIALVRQLTPCENGGNHHLHILVLDQQGSGIPNLPVEIVWPSGSYVDTTGKKVEFNQSLGIDANTTPGYLNFPLYHGIYKARVLAGVSEQTDWLSVAIPHDELCVRSDNPVGNSLFHYSYLVVFRKAR
jgi:hypothetical protein